MSESVLNMKPAARWTNDCQGKKDYDGKLISISTRYWPRGGGFNIFDSAHPERGFVSASELHPEIRPSAVASIHVLCGVPDEDGYNSDYAKLSEKHFEEETEDAVKKAVEIWVAAEYKKVVTALLLAYGLDDLRTQ